MISHTFICTLISKMVHGFHNNDIKIINLLKLRHIWFIPYLNIDTYKYIQSYSGSVSDVQNLVKTRKVISGCSDLDTGINLLNNYAYEWGYDNFGSSGTECLSNYRGDAAFSAAETAAVITLLDTAQSPTIVLSIDSSQNYIKYPYNYLNDKLDTPLNSSDSYWFYRAINRDVDNYNLGISMGNYISLFLKTNNGDNDDYFLLTKSTMSYSWNVGYKSYGTLYLNSTTQDKISTILTSNLDLGIYSIQKSGEQILAEVKFFNVCLPITDECNEYEPNNGNWKFYFHIYIYNSGMRDLTTESTVTISISNENMSFDTNSYSSRTSAYKRNLALSQTSINKSTFYSKEKDVIDFSSLISYNSNGDPMKDSSSLGSINISLTYYGSTVLIKQIVMSSYSSYKSELDSYYSPLIERSTFIIFILFCCWIFLHSIFLVLQVKLNIIERIIKKVRSIKKHETIKEQQPVIATKEDDFLHYQMNSDPNITGFDRSLKDSVTRSNIDLIPKIHQEMNSLRSSKDKDFTKDDDSGEICEYQTKESEPKQTDQRLQNLRQSIEPVEEDPHGEDLDSDSKDDVRESHEYIGFKANLDQQIFIQEGNKSDKKSNKVTKLKDTNKKSARELKKNLEFKQGEKLAYSYVKNASYNIDEFEDEASRPNERMQSNPLPIEFKEQPEGEDSDSKIKRKIIILSQDGSEIDKSGFSHDDQPEVKIVNPKTPTKKGTSKFYPKAKGLKNDLSQDTLEEKNKDSNLSDENPERPKSNERKLNHKNIASFYPKEYTNEEEIDNNPTNELSPKERVKSIIENKRYLSKTKKKEVGAKSQDFGLNRPILNKSSLKTILNSPYADNKLKINALMMASIKESDEMSNLGPGFGKNQRINKITEEDKKNRVVKDEEINLNVTSFYESNKSTVEAQKPKEDEEAKE